MKKPSPALQELLYLIRGNPAFPELLEFVERPRISPFRASDADHTEKSRAKWIHESGKLHQHNSWLAFLTGNQPSEQENP